MTPSWSSEESDFGANDMAVGDFNGDGFTDVVAIRFTDAVMVELFVNRDGELETQASVTMPYGGASIGAVGAGDLNGDSMTDLVLGYSGAPMAAYTNEGTPADAPILASFDVEGSTLTVNGGQFRAPMQVFAGEHRLSNVVVGDDTVTAKLPELAEGRYEIVVVNPGLRAAASPDRLVIGNPPEEPDDENGDTDDSDGQGAADEAGCGCRAAGPQSGLGALLLLGCVALGLRRRRRR